MKMTGPKTLKIGKLTLLGLFMTLFAAQPVLADDVSPSSWKVSADIYAWTPSIKGETAQGGDIDISFSDIVDNLDFALMAGLTARKGKLTLLVDAIYMDLKDNSTYTINNDGLVNLSVSHVELRSWVVTPMLGYNVVNSERLQLDLLAGARYLYMRASLDLEELGPATTRQFSTSGSGDIWDGIVGARGIINMNETWYLPFHFDVGTGDTNLTWQAFGGIGYKFSSIDVVAGYRHLEWDFDDNDTGGNLFNDLYISGPVLGFRYSF